MKKQQPCSNFFKRYSKNKAFKTFYGIQFGDLGIQLCVLASQKV